MYLFPEDKWDSMVCIYNAKFAFQKELCGLTHAPIGNIVGCVLERSMLKGFFRDN